MSFNGGINNQGLSSPHYWTTRLHYDLSALKNRASHSLMNATLNKNSWFTSRHTSYKLHVFVLINRDRQNLPTWSIAQVLYKWCVKKNHIWHETRNNGLFLWHFIYNFVHMTSCNNKYIHSFAPTFTHFQILTTIPMQTQLLSNL